VPSNFSQALLPAAQRRPSRTLLPADTVSAFLKKDRNIVERSGAEMCAGMKEIDIARHRRTPLFGCRCVPLGERIERPGQALGRRAWPDEALGFGSAGRAGVLAAAQMYWRRWFSILRT